jgi:hypothetical protein
MKLETLGLRLLAAKILLNRSGSTSLTEWASRVECSKQLLSWHLKQLEDSTDLHWLGGKKYETRATYSKATKARWAKLSPAERIARHHGKQAAQSAPPAAVKGVSPTYSHNKYGVGVARTLRPKRVG